jgi:hypothetical protein
MPAPGGYPFGCQQTYRPDPSHLRMIDELSEWEHHDIQRNDGWAHEQRKEKLGASFGHQPNKQMFGNTWLWHGEFRKSDKKLASTGRGFRSSCANYSTMSILKLNTPAIRLTKSLCTSIIAWSSSVPSPMAMAATPD